MKVAIWAKSPSPHQQHLYAALRQRGVDVCVRYLGELRRARRDIGWSESYSLPDGDSILQPNADPLSTISDWRDRVHVVPGYSRALYRRVAKELSAAGVPWTHWSERSRCTWRSPFTWAVKRWYAGLVNQRALGAFAQGKIAEESFRRWGIRPDRIAHLYYSVPGFVGESGRDSQTDAFVGARLAFVYVGSVSRAKASLALLKAFYRLTAEYSHVALVYVGAGPQLQKCQKRAASLGLGDKVLFRGVMPITQVGGVLNCGHVLVQPSLHDGWGVVLNEGASAGMALIATDKVGAAHHLIEPGRNGFRVEAGDTSALTAAMRSYANDRRLAAAHGAYSRELYQHFTPDANAHRFVTAISLWLSQSSKWNRFRDAWAPVATKILVPVSSELQRLHREDAA